MVSTLAVLFLNRTEVPTVALPTSTKLWKEWDNKYSIIASRTR